MSNGDDYTNKLLAALDDDTLRDIITTAADQSGVDVAEGDIPAIAAAIRQGARQACAEAWRENEVRQRDTEVKQMIQRETLRFMRQVGVGPSGRHQTL